MIRRVDLITPEYTDLQRELHARPEGYGGKGKRWVETVIWLCKRYDCWSVLDYGCGQGSLSEKLTERGIACRNYDPAVKGADDRPAFADLVVCTDVLEHVEPTLITNVLNHIHSLARKAIFVVVSLRESNKTMADGRNAHLLVRPQAWWEAKVEEGGWLIDDTPDLPLPAKMTREKQWIAVFKVRR